MRINENSIETENKIKPIQQIRHIDTNALIPYVNNSRIHSEDQINQVASSIKEFGFTNPILIDNDNGIIAGHCRVLAAKKLHIDKVPTIKLEYLTDAQRKAYIIADNKIATNSTWNDDLLKVELEALNELDFDLSLTGFSDDELDLILDDMEVEDGLTDEDHVPDVEENKKPVTKLGDVWILGNHRLMCGDSTNIDDVDKLLNGQEPNTMITDPPYGVEYDASWRANAKHTIKTDREKTGTLKNDNKSDWYDAYILHKGNITYVWHASSFTDVVMDGLKRAGFEIKSQIIWNKNVHVLSRSDYQWKHEPCWYAVKSGAKHNWKGGRNQMTIWDVKNVMFEKDAGGKTPHPTQKPVELYIKSIENHTNSGEYIYEPFGGSGTSIIAAEKTNRRSLSMELDEKFCDVIIKRWQEYTGKEAYLESNGKSYREMESKNG